MNFLGRLLGTGIRPLALVALAPLFLYADVNEGVEAQVREYFADIPIMAEIAECESRFRQFDSSGAPLPGGLGGNMIGVFQINAPVHAEYALGLGMNIYTLEGNLAYAKYLYENDGTRPWRSSRACWSKAEEEEIARLQALIVELTAKLHALKQKLAMGQHY
ncbi:hypothetical protein HY414_00515 [Candidatus Kaiserbacteria bacterium]|nr:hypothetical protein [Candidatus Kaiserbacteria bacterium]